MERPKVPQEIADSFEKLPATTRQKYQFLADYPEYLINQNREELVKAIDSIRKDFQDSTEKIAKELCKASARTAWTIAVVSLFGGFLLGLFSPEFKAVVSLACETISNAISPEATAPKTISPERQSR